MTRNTFLNVLTLLLLLVSKNASAQVKNAYSATSPDKVTRIEMRVDQPGNLQYRVFYSGEEVTTWSAMGFIINDVAAGKETVIKGKSQAKHVEAFAWRLGEN